MSKYLKYINVWYYIYLYNKYVYSKLEKTRGSQIDRELCCVALHNNRSKNVVIYCPFMPLVVLPTAGASWKCKAECLQSTIESLREIIHISASSFKVPTLPEQISCFPVPNKDNE